MPTDKATVLWQIDAVLGKFWAVDGAKRSGPTYWDELEEAELTALVRNAIELFRPPHASVYSDTVISQMTRDGNRIYALRSMAGLLTALRADYADDRLRNVSELVRADLFNDLLEMATHLLEQNYKDAAAVFTDKDGQVRPKKLDTMNADLARAGVYNTIEQKDITTQAGIRNAAAHGKYGEYDLDQVQRMIEAVRSFIARHPA